MLTNPQNGPLRKDPPGLTDPLQAKLILADIEQICCLLPGGSSCDGVGVLLQAAALLRASRLSGDPGRCITVTVDRSRDFQNRLEPNLICFNPDYLLGEPGKRAALVGFEDLPAAKLQRYLPVMSQHGVKVVAEINTIRPIIDGTNLYAGGLQPDKESVFPHLVQDLSREYFPCPYGADEVTCQLFTEAARAMQGDYTSELRQGLKQALQVLDDRSGLQGLHLPEHQKRDLGPTLAEWIQLLATSPTLEGSLAELAKDYRQAVEVVQDHLSRAIILAPGIYALPFVSCRDPDPFVRGLLENKILLDSNILVALDHTPDTAGTKLSRATAQEFRVRLSIGEDPEKIVADLEEALWESDSSLRAAMVDLYRHRERDPEGIIEYECELAEYFPDPDGRYCIVKAPSQLDIPALFEHAGIEIVHHATTWWTTVEGDTLSSRPSNCVFKAAELPQVIQFLRKAIKKD